MYIDCYYFECTFDNKTQNNLLDCFSEKKLDEDENDFEINDRRETEINDRRGTQKQTVIRKHNFERRDNNNRINGIKRETMTSTSNRRETNVFESKFFTPDTTKQNIINRIQSYKR